MKVSVEINGVELKLDGEVDETVDFVSKLQAKGQKIQQERAEVRAARVEKAVELNKVQFALWEYLVDNDCETGLPIAAVHRHFQEQGDKANEDAIGQRLATLARQGYAYRPGRGRYRAKEKD